MNDNGFTLIELLATIVILGIITAMSFPVLRKISEDSMNKKLKTYANSVESSAKLYVDSYSEDLFGRDKSGIVCVTYDELKSKSLIKDISDNDISCNSNKTIVQVTKLGDAYTYDVQLGCTNSKNSDESNLIIFPKNSNLKCETSSTTLKYDLNVSPGKYTDNDKNRSAVTVTLSSDTGINNKYNEIYYSWTLNPNNGNDTWNKLNFDIPSADQQKKDLISNKISEVVVKKQLILPEKTGKWYLKIEVRSLQNAAGDNLLTEKQNKQYGPYTIDRDSPIIRGVTLTSRESGFNSKSIRVNINATDNNRYTADSDLQYCVNTSSSCSSYSKANVKDLTLSGNYDGSSRKIYVYVKDQAGNVTSSSESYTLYKECSTTTGEWKDQNTCSKTCGTGTKRQTKVNNDKYTGKLCSTDEQTINCNTQLCAPNKPTIKNPTNGNWVNYDFSLNVGTSTPSNQLGYWYYRYNYTGWTRYDDSYGKDSYTTTLFSAERNEPVYIRVCNKEANIDNPESSKCAQSDTTIKIDKTAPECKSSGGSDSWTNDSRTLVGTCSDTGGSGCKESASWLINWQGSWTNLSPGFVYDNAGNKNYCPTDQTVKIDKTPPTISFYNGARKASISCTTKTYPGTNKRYPQTVNGLNWQDTFSGVGNVYMLYKWDDKCSYFNINQNGNTDLQINNGIWIKYGGPVSWKLIVCDVVGNCSSTNGSTNCHNTRNNNLNVKDGATTLHPKSKWNSLCNW